VSSEESAVPLEVGIKQIVCFQGVGLDSGWYGFVVFANKSSERLPKSLNRIDLASFRWQPQELNDD
jgi:hypothetical protein